MRAPLFRTIALLSLGSVALAAPQTVAGLDQQAYLKASNTGFFDTFGAAVALDRDTAVVGAPLERSAATGVDGDQGDDSLSQAGAAYVFLRDGFGWHQEAYLKASNTGLVDHFGHAVAVSGDTIAIGAPDEDGDSTGVNGDETNAGASSAGAVYVFVRNGATWTQQAYVKASNARMLQQFGWSVALDGDTLVVGAPAEASAATGVDGDGNDESAFGAGAAYVFVRSGTTWTQQAYLKASNTDGFDRFGTSVAVSGDTVVVGAPFEDGAGGIGGNEADDTAGSAGAAYVFVRSGATWSQQSYLKASNTGAGDEFGTSVAVAGDTIAVGAQNESSDADGVDGAQGNDAAPSAGAAYVFTRVGTSWIHEAYLKASDSGAEDQFGARVGLSGGTLVVGALGEDSAASDIDGDGTDDSFPGAGAAYFFRLEGAGWRQLGYLKPHNPDGGDTFGYSAAASGTTVLVGATNEDGSATGVDGADDDGVAGSGAVYVFEDYLPVGTPRCFCTAAFATCGNADAEAGCANSAGFGARLRASGSSSLADQASRPLVLEATHGRPDKACVWLQGATGQQTNFHDGNLCVGNPTIRLPGFGCAPFPIGTLDASGSLATDHPLYGFDVLAAALCKGDDIAAATPTMRDYQLWYRDGMGPCGTGSNLTNAVRIAWVP